MGGSYPALQHIPDAAQILEALAEQVLSSVQEHIVGMGLGVRKAAGRPGCCLS